MRELRKDAGQLIIAGIEGKTLPDDVADALRDEELAGLILFRRNLGSVDDIVALTQSIHDAADGFVPFVAIDQEGGLVQRIKAPLTVWPPMMAVALAEDADLAARVGEAIADEVAWLGFNLNFAPVADIHTHPDNPIIGHRAFGTTPEQVSRYAGAFAAGMTIAGVMPCAKHFPGHGDTTTDSHLELPVVHSTLQELSARELAPFAAMIRAHVPMIMTAHILFPALDAELPATLSPRIISELLRLKLGFDGIVISDDLNMKALADSFTIEEMVTLGLRAGVDIFLVCEHEERRLETFEALVHLGEKSSLDRERIQMAASRVRRTRAAWLRPWTRTRPVLQHDALEKHAALAQKLRDILAAAGH